MAVLARLPAALDGQLQRDAQLSLIEYYVLAVLSDMPGFCARISELAQLANAELSRVSHLVTRLERRGYLRREPDPADGRYTLAVLSSSGRDQLIRAAPGHVDAVRELVVGALDPESLAGLRDSCERIAARISSASAPGNPRRAGRR